MNGYSKFVDQLDVHLKAYRVTSQQEWKKDGLRFVDGLAAEELRRLVGLEKRREFGAFFTTNELSDQLIANPKVNFGKECIIYDPAVGAGNLLIAAYKYLHKKVDCLTLLGTDLHIEFIQAAELRLKITNLLNSNSKKQPEINVNLSVNDGLQDNSCYATATHIVTNPPFNLIDGDESIMWGKGKLSAAAVFIDHIIRHIKPGTQIIAILPDVLRSGSRYEKWRAMIEEHCIIHELIMLGQFDKHTDIDVFSIIITKKTRPEHIQNRYHWTTATQADQAVEDLFEVSVGNVVDNRDPNKGTWRPFLVSRGLPGWQEITNIDRKRRFSGRSISPPFVVVKRTSRMGDQHRAIATIINTGTDVYVDNHLIVLKPKSGQLIDCRLLIKALESTHIDDWINEQIRCRHLTVKIVAKIPL